MEIQKIFTDIYGEERLYSVLLTEEELSLFSNLDEDGLSRAEKNTIWLNKHLMTKGDREAYIQAYGEGKHGRRIKRAATAIGIGAGIGAGALTGIATRNPKAALASAGVAGALGAGLGALSTKADAAIDRAAKKNNSYYESKMERNVDLMRVSNGDMTKEQYAKKWNKKKKKH